MRRITFALGALMCLFVGAGRTCCYAQQQDATSGACEQELWIETTHGRKVFGILNRPKTDGRQKVAVVSHGFNGTHHFARDYFETLAQLGYMTYTFDFPCGSLYSQSDNNTMGMSLLDEKEDLKSIVEYFYNRSDVDTVGLVLIGESQGGLVSALAAAELQDRVSRLVLVYPALCIPDNWNSRYATPAEIPDTTRLWNVPIGRRFFEELRGMEVYKEIVRYRGPVQIIHGSHDRVVPLQYSERAGKCYREAHLDVISGAGHGFNLEERKLSNALMEDFLSGK